MPDFTSATKPRAKVVAHIQTDPHVLKQTYRVPIAYSDFNFCMQDYYREEGEILLPYAYDPEIHFHEDRKKIYDACLIGLHYKHRDDLINRLKERGLNVYYSIGEIYDQYRQKYNESKIALSWSSLEDLPSRVWESLGWNWLLSRIEHLRCLNSSMMVNIILGFNDVDEAEQQVMTLLADEKLRDKIAKAGTRKRQD